MSVQRLTIDLPQDVAAYVTQTVRPLANDAQSIQRFGDLIDSIAGGQKNAKIRLNVGAVRASATVTFASFVDTDTVTINGVVFTGKTSGAVGDEFNVGTNQVTANNARTAINASATAKIPGVIKATRRGTVTLASFANTNTITVNGIVFTGKTTPDAGIITEFAIGASNNLTTGNLLAALNRAKLVFPALSLISMVLVDTGRGEFLIQIDNDGALTLAASANATVASDIVVINSIIPGTIGNLCTLAISAHGSVSAAALSGGTEGTQTILGPSANVL